MYKNKLNDLLTLVLLSSTLCMTSCAQRNFAITVSQEEIKEEVAKLEQLKKDGKLASELQNEYGKIFADLDGSCRNGLDTPKGYEGVERAENNYLDELEKLKAISEKANSNLEELAVSIIRVRKAKKIYDRECERVESTK